MEMIYNIHVWTKVQIRSAIKWVCFLSWDVQKFLSIGSINFISELKDIMWTVYVMVAFGLFVQLTWTCWTSLMPRLGTMPEINNFITASWLSCHTSDSVCRVTQAHPYPIEWGSPWPALTGWVMVIWTTNTWWSAISKLF